MSDEAPLTEEQLVQATSRTPAPNAALDAQTAALRDGYLRLGSAIEQAASGDFDEARLLARLPIAGGREVSPVLPARPRSKWLPLVLAGALAASALVVIVRAIAVWSPPQVAVKAPNEAAAPQPDMEASIGGSPSAGWSDPLDDEIASAQDAVERIHRRPDDLDGSLESFGSRLEALAAELESGSL